MVVDYSRFDALSDSDDDGDKNPRSGGVGVGPSSSSGGAHDHPVTIDPSNPPAFSVEIGYQYLAMASREKPTGSVEEAQLSHLLSQKLMQRNSEKTGDIPEAARLAKACIRISHALSERGMQAKGYLDLAQALYLLDDPSSTEEAIKHFTTARRFFEKSNEYLQDATTVAMGLGRCYQDLGYLAKADEEFTRAKKLAETDQDDKNIKNAKEALKEVRMAMAEAHSAARQDGMPDYDRFVRGVDNENDGDNDDDVDGVTTTTTTSARAVGPAEEQRRAFLSQFEQMSQAELERMMERMKPNSSYTKARRSAEAMVAKLRAEGRDAEAEELIAMLEEDDDTDDDDDNDDDDNDDPADSQNATKTTETARDKGVKLSDWRFQGTPSDLNASGQPGSSSRSAAAPLFVRDIEPPRAARSQNILDVDYDSEADEGLDDDLDD